MSLPLSDRARRSSQSSELVLNLVLDIDGVTDKYGTVPILKFVRIGDTELLIGDDWKIGGQSPIENQLTAVSFDGSSTSVSQKLDIDKGSGSTLSQMAVALVDIGEQITRLISPGEVVDDLLGRDASVWLGFGEDSFPEDYIRIHRGIIDDINSLAGKVILQISHPDKKKQQDIFIKASSNIDGDIDDMVTTIPVVSTTNFLTRVLGPDGTYDSAIQYGIRIEDEVVFFTGISGNNFTGCVRGSLGTTAASHADQTQADSFLRIGPINSIDLALKIMLSGWGGYYEEDVAVKNFTILGDLTAIDNSVFFLGIDVAESLGVVVGDYVTIASASETDNNFTLRQVLEVVLTLEGSYIVVDGDPLVYEIDSSAMASFRSQYDTFALGVGLQMHNKEVDISEHELIKRRFLSSFDYDFYIHDTWKAKDFLEQQIYFPAAAYSLPRKARASVGFHIGPLPDSEVKIIDTNRAVNAQSIGIRRSISKNFYNTVVYKYEEKVLDEDKFLRGYITTDGPSRDRITVGTNALVIPAKGMRFDLSGDVLTVSAANRRLNRYKFAAEYVDNIQITMGYSFNVEIGDIIVLDLGDLQISDTKNSSRHGKPRLFEVVNKTFDIKTGKVTFSLVDTAYSNATRYCLMSPSSKIISGSTSTNLKLTQTSNSLFGPNEGGKWSRYIGAVVRVRSSDFTTRNDTSIIQSVVGNTVVLESALGFTPQADDTLTVADYDEMSDKVADRIKLIYGFLRDSNFGDGTSQYQMI